MRKFYHVLFFLTMLVMAGGMWSCSEESNPTTEGTPVVSVEAPGEGALFTTSATFKLTTKGAESYVYKVVEGADVAEPDPVIVYAEAQANGSIVTVTGETAEATVTGLEGNKTYTVFFVFKVGTSYEIRSQVITTPGYSQMVTVVSANMFEIKLHVEVPEDMYYSLGFTSLENYIAYRDQFGRQDVDWVVYGGGAQNPRYKGPQTISIAKDANAYEGALNESDYEPDYFLYSVVPGTGYVAFVSQCDADGSTDAFTEMGEGGGFPGILLSTTPDQINIKEYTEEAPSSDYAKFTGKYAKTVLFTEQATVGEGGVEIKTDRVTEKTVLLSLVPSENLFQYSVMLVDDVQKESFVTACGGEDGVQAATLNYGTVMDGAQQIAYPVEQGHSYTLYVVGVGDETGTVQTFNTMEGIKPIVSDKPAVELDITALPADNPYQVGFNIKAPNSDCTAFKYLCNYTKEWWPMLNGMEGTELEANIASMMTSYGVVVNAEEVISAINSANGFDLYFSSMDDTESWIVIESYNADEKTKLFYDEPGCKASSAVLTPETPVNSELFTKLLGNWEATMTRGNGTGTDSPVSMPVTIAAGPVQQSTLPADVKQSLVDYFTASGMTATEAEVAVEGYFNEYKERASYYTQKNKNQNCLVASGFSYDPTFAPFASSWDLFCSTDYSAYSTDELFRDYGPKLYFKIAKDEAGKDSVSVIVTRTDETGYNYLRYVDPVADWYQTTVLCAFNAANPDNYYVTEFPVEISDDMNTITIKPMVQGGASYSPGFAIEYVAGSPYWSFPTNTDGIVLKRVSGSANASSRSMMSVSPQVKANSGSHFRRTRAPYGYTVKTPVDGSVFSMEAMTKSLKK